MERMSGRIRFKNNRLQRKRGGKLSNAHRAGISHGAAKPQFETEPDERFCLLATAIEGMRNAPPDPNAAQALQYLIDSSSHMQQHGQVEFPGYFKMFNKKEFLAERIETRRIVIKSDFADSDRRRLSVQFVR